ncbi:membrane protein [Bacillus coahuilensis p1.1.43]|uniref:Membrane protein n=1 Tax=Bacillus coahuilensis p1.1.43 TaxID=1150625 RepID=A0A147K5U0_9BACI|nr:nucleoside recognition domain-containing protein [Bacillus coahuilensis]KUP05212.1 membrane protein [Bacillus coahuilensis p1.1.43]
MVETLKKGLQVGLQTTWKLGRIIFPITLIVTLLHYTPLLTWVIKRIEPLMSVLGLPGDAAIPLVFGNFLNLYAAIGAILSFEFTVKEVFILAVMLSFCHNLLVESSVAAGIGLKIWVILLIRIGLAVISAILINLVWSGGSEIAKYGMAPPPAEELIGFGAIFVEGLTKAGFGVAQLAMIVIPLMVMNQILKDRGYIATFSRWMAPVMRMLGMNENTSTTMVAGLTMGLAYGAGVMIQAVKEDGVSKKDVTLAFIFLIACHAVVEDTLIFIPLGIPVIPLLLFRIITAILLTMIIAFIWNRVEVTKRREEVLQQ